jgi:DNA-binding MarR family transcriptional regulator
MAEDEIDRIIAQWNRVRPDVDVSATHVVQRIVRLDLLLQSNFAQVFARYGVSWAEYTVLAALRRAGPPYRMNPTSLFNTVILSSGGMTKLLDRLERTHLVKRQADPDDRRGRLVVLTRKGLELVDRAMIEHLANEERLLGALTTTERQQLSGLLRKMLLSEPFQAPATVRRTRKRTTLKEGNNY